MSSPTINGSSGMRVRHASQQIADWYSKTCSPGTERCAPGEGHDAERAHVVAPPSDTDKSSFGSIWPVGSHVGVSLLKTELHVHRSPGPVANIAEEAGKIPVCIGPYTTISRTSQSVADGCSLYCLHSRAQVSRLTSRQDLRG